jgi:hypothetical protein
VTKLGLKNLEFAGELIDRLASSKLAGKLVALDLSMSTFDSTHAPLLAEIANRFPALKSLDISDNFLEPEDVAAIRKAFKQAKVVSDDQSKRESVDDDDPDWRFASVTE